MKKEKKGIRCSYALLVIILFAAVCILTDYIVIDRKVNKCNCSKCEVTTNNEEKESINNSEQIIGNNSSNEQIIDNDNIQNVKKYSYTSFSGKYKVDYDLYSYIKFSEDGTWIGEFNFCEGYAEASGKYTIEENNIFLNAYDRYKKVEINGETFITDQFLPSKVRIIDSNDNYPIVLQSIEGFTNGCSSGTKYVFVYE